MGAGSDLGDMPYLTQKIGSKDCYIVVKFKIHRAEIDCTSVAARDIRRSNASVIILFESL